MAPAYPLHLLVTAVLATTAPAPPDTMHVEAPRVTVAEVVAAIGARMAADTARLDSYESTSLVTRVLRDAPGPGADRTVEEMVRRYRHDPAGGDQAVTLWERRRRYEDGALVSDRTSGLEPAQFLAEHEPVLAALPFAPGGAARYRYEIEDRRLVGESVVYRVAFEPRSRFAALPTGTIWVDVSNWVIRRTEARLVGAAPYPLFVRAIPLVRIDQERFGDHWFTSRMRVRTQFRRLPLVGGPADIEVCTQLRDVVIDGRRQLPTGLLPESPRDSVAAYWSALDAAWEADLPPDIGTVPLPEAAVDSLSDLGAARLRTLRSTRHWRLEADLLRTPDFNRVQGLVPRVGLALGPARGGGPRLDLEAGVGTADRRAVARLEAMVPLVRGRWLARPVLALELAASRDGARFGGDGRRHTRALTAALYGADPPHHFEVRRAGAGMRWRPARGLTVRAGFTASDERPRTVATAWNLLGWALSPAANRPATPLKDRAWALEMERTAGTWRWEAAVVRHHLRFASPVERTDLQTEWRLGAAWEHLDRHGHRWVLRGGHRGWSGTAPAQGQVGLGDWGTLRGRPAGALRGDRGAHAALDVRWNWDPWRALRVPLLAKLRLQPSVFVDWGRAWGGEEPGWGVDAGIGFGRRLDLPGLGALRHVRVYVGRPVAGGDGGTGWRVLVGVER